MSKELFDAIQIAHNEALAWNEQTAATIQGLVNQHALEMKELSGRLEQTTDVFQQRLAKAMERETALKAEAEALRGTVRELQAALDAARQQIESMEAHPIILAQRLAQTQSQIERLQSAAAAMKQKLEPALAPETAPVPDAPQE
jgi:chromosome segregation ATPase